MTGRLDLDRANSDVVLIVDDVPDNLAVLHDALDESGYTVLVATGGEAALQRAAQALPDIVLLDAMMPGMDGFEVAKRLKASSQTAHIPIIFMTGLTETEHLVAALEAGGVDYVTKPIKPKEVLARMGVHVQGARQARQTRNALDAFGYASITVRAGDGKLMWQSPQPGPVRRPACRSLSGKWALPGVSPNQKVPGRDRRCEEFLLRAQVAQAPRAY